MANASVNGITIFYRTFGEGTPLLFIHGGYGGPLTSVLPAGVPPLVDALADAGVRTVVYDRRCSGRSDYVTTAFTLDDLAGDAAGVLDHLGIDRAIVLGSSAGGPIALSFALARPERVIGLALANTGPALMVDYPDGFEQPYPNRVTARRDRARSLLAHVEDARRLGDRAAFEARRQELLGLRQPPGSTAPSPEEEDAQRRALAAIDDRTLFTQYIGMVRNYAAYEGRDLTSRLDEISVPTFIVHGTADRAVPIEYSRLMHERIGGSELHEIEGAGHGISANAQALQLLRGWAVSLTGT